MENNKKQIYLVLGVGILALLAFLGYKYFISNKLGADQKDIQRQIDYSFNTKKLLDEKPFIDKLPYRSANFDIYYSTVTDEIQIIMNNKGLTYEDAKKTNESAVYYYLTSIGVPLKTQKIVWLLAQ